MNVSLNCMMANHNGCDDQMCMCGCHRETKETCPDCELKDKYKEFASSVACLIAEGVEFMTKAQLWDAVKADYERII